MRTVRTLIVLVSLASVAAAQTEDEVIVVTGTRIPTPLERFGGAATVITARDVELRQYRSIADALASVPGLHVASSGGPGAQTSVFLRGAESDHVLVRIDGVEVTPAGGGNFGFEHLQLNAVERIEVLRGPYSSLYGSQGIGGVINIVTKRGEGAPGATAHVETGSFGTNAVAARLSGRREHVDFSLGGAWLRRDGESHTPRRLGDRRRGDDDGYDNLDVKGTLGIETGAASRADFSFGYIDAEAEYDGGGPVFEQTGLTSSVRRERYSARWSGNYRRGAWRPSLRGDYYAHRRDDAASRSRGERTRFEWSNELFFSDAVKLVAGAETEFEKFRGSSGSVRASARTNAVYLQAWFELLDSLLLSGGLRHDDPDDFGSDRNWQVAATYDWVAIGTRLRASYGTAFKAPSLSDRFASWGNPGLGAETSRGWEAGIDQSLALFGGPSGARWGFTYFDNRIRRLITAAPPDFTLQNAASAGIEGIEAFVALEISPGLDLRLDQTVMRAFDGGRERLLRRPLRKTTVTARWSKPLWSLAATVDYVGPWRDIRRDDFSFLTRGGYTLAHVSARRRIGGGVTLFARANNLFDRDYEPVDGFAGRGFEFHAGVEADL